MNEISAAAAALGRLGRAKNTVAQQEASRKNGKRGGRPRSWMYFVSHESGWRWCTSKEADRMSKEGVAVCRKDFEQGLAIIASGRVH